MLVPLYPALVQAQPGHGPGYLQEEDEADTDCRRDTEGSQSRHDLTGERRKMRIKFLSQELTVQAPIPNARMSVRLVTVTDTPACCIVRPSLSGRGRFAMVGSLWRLYQQAMMTNMSSIPIPCECERIISVWINQGILKAQYQILAD